MLQLVFLRRLTPMLALVLVAGAALSVAGCGSEPATGGAPAPDRAEPAPPGNEAYAAAPYDFAAPEVSFALPPELEEISALTVLEDSLLGAVQDEDGILFVLSPRTGAVEARRPFGGPGDYEGIEWAKGHLFVLRSDGTLIRMPAAPQGEEEVRTYETPLTEDNDTEGLAYDPERGHLLVAAKEEPGARLTQGQKAIYAFDLARGELLPEPTYVIETRELRQRFGLKGKFKPSALAIHPKTGELYVLSSKKPALAVLNREGQIQSAWPLPASLFEQPEGIAFLPDGTLYLASEGDDGPPMLYRFAYRASS